MLNEVRLIGNLGRDPKKITDTIAALTVAVTRRYKSKEEEWREITDWLDVTCFGRQVDFCTRYLHKGSRVLIMARVQKRKIEKDDGSNEYRTEIIAQEVKSLSSKREEEPAQEEDGF